MFKTRSRKILRDLLSRKGRTALVSISIAFGVMGAVVLVTASDLMTAKLEEDIRTDRLPMVGIEFKSETEDPADIGNRDEIIELLRVYPGVTTIQGEQHATIFWRAADDKGFVQGRIHAYSVPFDEILLESPTLYQGRFPEPGQREVVIERRMAEEYGFEVGDPLVIRILSQLTGFTAQTTAIPEETWTITGLVYNPYIWGSTRTSVYAHFDDLAYITGDTVYDRVALRFADFPSALAESQGLRALIDQQTPYEIEEMDLDNPAEAEVITNVGEWADLLSTLAWVAVIVACFLVVSVVTTIMVEQRNQIGIVKVLGANRWDTFRIYLGLTFIYGVLGTIPGVLIGVPLGFMVTQATAPLLNVVFDGFVISWKAVLTGAAMGMVMPVLVSILPVFVGTSVSVREALSDFGIAARFGRSRLSRVIGRAPVSSTTRQAIANVYQKPGRLLLTVLSLAAAAGAFMGVVGLLLSLSNKIEDVYETFNYQLGIYPDWQTEVDYEAGTALLQENVADVAAIYPTRILDAELVVKLTDRTGGPERIETVFVEAFDPHTNSIKPHLREGRAWQDNPDREGIVISYTVADNLGLGLGNMVIARYQDTELELEIIGVDNLPYDIAFMPVETAAYLEGTTGADAFLLRFADDDINAAEVDRRAGEIRELMLEHGIMAGFYNQRADVQEEMDIVWRISSLLGVLASIMAAVGAVGLLTSLSIGVFERQREIGVMRSVGASSRAVAQQFLTEGLLVGALAWTIGVPLGFLIAGFLWDMMPNSELNFSYPLATVALGLGGMLLVSAIASLWPSLAASHRTVSTILRYR
jgi:putative ABC transport system permease protein